MRKLIIGLGIGVAAIIVIAAAALFLVDVNRYRGAVQAQLERQLGRSVTLGQMHLGILPLRLQVENPVIAEDPAVASQSPFIRADKLDVRVGLASLTGGNVNVHSLELERPVVQLIRNKRGEWNFSTLGGKSPDTNTRSSNDGSARGFALEHIAIHDGRLSVNGFAIDHIDMTSGIKNANGVLTIDDTKVRLGQTPIDVAGTITTNTTPAQLNLTMKTGSVPIDDIAHLASALGIAFAPGTNVNGKAQADLKVTGSAASPVMTGTIAGRDVRVSGKDVPQPVEVKAIDVTLTPEEIRSNDFTATSGKTNVASHFAVKQYMSSSPSMDLTLRAPNATLPEIQSIARAYGIKGLDQVKGNGNLNLDMHAAGPLQSFTSEHVMRAINGNMDLNFDDVRISGFDLGHELGAIGGFLGASSSGNDKVTDIIKLAGHVAVANGIAHTDDLKAQMNMGNVSAVGTGDLATEALNLKLTAVLSKAFADKVGGGNIAGYMKTVFGNTGGEMTIPVLVTGTFKQPRFSPDTQSIVQLQKQKLIPGLQQGQKPQDTVKGILGGLFGGKK
ncbi:MAG TPA: AsmA family protein [Terriglobia bacterium]|nr:AsmA family protein [Terriglobia bacterium]